MAPTPTPPERSLVDRARRKLAARGLKGTFTKFIGDHIWRRDRFFVMAMDPDAVDGDRLSGADEHYSVIKIEQVADIPPLRGWLAHRKPDFEAMIADGSIGYMAIRDGMATGCMWLATRPFHDASLNAPVSVEEGEVFAFAFLIDHEMRRSGLGAKLGMAVLHDIKRSGFRRVFTYCAEDNQASFRIMYWLGMRPTGSLLIVSRLFRRTIAAKFRPFDGVFPPGWRIPRRSIT